MRSITAAVLGVEGRSNEEARVAVTKAEHIALIVVTYNSADLLVGLGQSLSSGLDPIPYSVVVVDNNSTDDSADLARQLPNVRVVQTGRNGGYSAGINAGIAAADPAATAYLILNPDVRLESGCGQHLLQALRTPGVGIAVPRLSDGNGNLIYSMRREPSLRSAFLETAIGSRRLARVRDIGETVYDPSKYETSTRTDWAEGSTQLISRECIEATGPWDESFFLFSEETEFALRASDIGFATVFVPAASATHLEGSRGDPVRSALACRNRVVLYSRRHAVPAAATFYLCSVVGELLRATSGRAESKAAVRVLLSRRRMRAMPGPDWLRSL
ncbi:glycosyltransferase [Flexivirga oryzae]|uniref:GT2 family glycosyltransferase n=1 Tax=Flexivirga oryzae TaxID=1794944 RepID=A0A839N211_9MICO|nr:GT2 family glycosyltransferase [Flexivirga oryzae]